MYESKDHLFMNYGAIIFAKDYPHMEHVRRQWGFFSISKYLGNVCPFLYQHIGSPIPGRDCRAPPEELQIFLRTSLLLYGKSSLQHIHIKLKSKIFFSSAFRASPGFSASDPSAGLQRYWYFSQAQTLIGQGGESGVLFFLKDYFRTTQPRTLINGTWIGDLFLLQIGFNYHHVLPLFP